MHEDEIRMDEELQPEETLPAEVDVAEQLPEPSAEPAPEAEAQPFEEVTLEGTEEPVPEGEIPVEIAEEPALEEDAPVEIAEVPAFEEIPEEIAQEQPVEAAEEEAAVEGEPAPEDTQEQPAEDAEASEEQAPAEPEMVVPVIDENTVPYHERYYLKYREGKRSTALDLEGTMSFLQALGFDGGELRKAREGKDCAENLRNNEQNKNNQMRCSYCGMEIAGVEFYRLPDGRLRCTNCSKTVVESKAEVEDLCRRVIDNMANFFGATIEVPVSIDVVDERKIKKQTGILGTKDSESILILGYATHKNKKYRIVLENGAPRISMIATFAHELTHIWQYTHWDKLPKCHKSKHLLIYEGMAKWAEIQYLYLVGETAVAKREELITRNRQDEYGIGFCLYEDMYPLSREAMFCDNTPFTTDKYPLE